MKYLITTTLEKVQALENSSSRTWVIQGGTSAGKTVAICIYIVNWLLTHPYKEAWIVSDTLANLKDGAMMDFMAILNETNAINYFSWNKSESVGEFKNGSIIKFRGVDTMRGHGPRRDLLYVNEANRIDWETYRQLAKRTRGTRIIDFNPVNEFWAHTELVNHPTRSKSTSFIKVTYQDNEALDEDTVADLEEERGDGTSNWWRVYGLGEIGSLEGNVYEGWIAEDELPKEGIALRRFGCDFGYNPDPTTAIAIYEDVNRDIWLKQLLYEYKLRTPIFIERCKEFAEQYGHELFVPDNSKPEIIREMQENGLRVIGCDKTPGEKMNGKRYNIELVKRRKIHYLRSDKELEREYLTYAWRKKKSTGEILDEPEDGNDHCMDAIAYAIRDLERKQIEYGGVR